LIRFSKEEWSDPYPVFEDGWTIPGCPVNGPALDAYENQDAIAWFTAPNHEAKVNIAFSKDGGRSFRNPIQIDHGSPIGRTDVIWLNDKTVLVSWIEEGEEADQLILKSIGLDDANIKDQKSFIINSGRGSGYPKLALSGNFIFITWTDPGDGGSIRSEWISIKKFL